MFTLVSPLRILMLYKSATDHQDGITVSVKPQVKEDTAELGSAVKRQINPQLRFQIKWTLS